MIRMNFSTANFLNYHSLKDSSRDFRVRGLPLVSANRGLHYFDQVQIGVSGFSDLMGVGGPPF